MSGWMILTCRRDRASFAVGVVLATIQGMSAQAPQSSTERDSAPVFRSGTQEILLDFVARDRHHNRVKNLRLDEIEIYEDGSRQTPKSFHYRDGGETQPAPRHGDGTGVDPLREINIVSIVFEGMGPETRARATRFAQEFLDTEMGQNSWIGVFTMSHQLSVIQPYTTDLALLRNAVKRAGAGDYQQFAKENVAIVRELNSLEADPTQFQPIQPGSAEERGPATPDRSLSSVSIRMNQLTLRMLMYQEGSRTIDALRSLVRQQARLPGRKTVLYLSEGLVVPPEQPELLQSIISEANRGNISFYTVDVRGLTTVSSLDVARTTTHVILSSEQDPGVLHTDLQQNARELAAGTGGFAMDNSNDLRGPLRRVMKDIRSHYEVTFSQPLVPLDGGFHTLEVRVKRPGVTVQGRRGFFALPTVAGETLEPFEMAALKVLALSPPPQDFAYRTAALRFRGNGNDVEYELVFSVPARALKAAIEPARKTFSLHISFIGVIRDENGEIARISRRDLPFQAPLEKRSQYEAGEVTATALVRLNPGRYRFEAVALDREAGSASVRKAALVVPSAAFPLQLSDLVWVRTVAQAQEFHNPLDPLESPAGRITPELNPSFGKSGSAAFYFIAWPAPQLAPMKPSAVITITHDGNSVAEIPLNSPAPDDDGAFRFTGEIPLLRFEPGQYELMVNVRDGAFSSQAWSSFSLGTD